MKAKYVYLTIDWNKEKSIKWAEAQKVRLENDGYTLINTVSGLTKSELTYKNTNQ